MDSQYMVTKANALVTSHYSLSLEEQRIILTLLSLIQPEDKDFKPYIFKIAEFMELLGVTDKSKYTTIPKITEGLMEKVVKFNDGNELIQAPWLAGAKYKKKSGTVELLLSPYLTPYLLGLKASFTSYQLENAIKLRDSMYSIRLYELMKCYEYKQSFEIKLSELIEMLKLGKSYFDYFDMKKRVIEPAQKEINAKTDILFDYTTITERKKVMALKFTIKPNPKNNPKLALPEPSKPTAPTTKTDIDAIQEEFRQCYKGKLVDQFVKQMLAEKGLAHVREYLRTYADYIQGRNIKNIAGDFYKFVMDGYEKPVSHKGNIPQRDNFKQRDLTDEDFEKFYTKLDYELSKETTVKPEVEPKLKPPNKKVKGKIDSLRSALKS
jgi:plasmid replication initiation protein